jgi:methylated-DNA-protein-cysteine methyltransferase-like protein
MDNTFEKIYNVVKRIPYGKVATYGQVAMLAGNPNWSRVVGYALHVNPDPDSIPCFRVVNRFGEPSSAFAFGGPGRQAELLQAEGVGFTDETHVDMARYRVSFLPGIPAEPQRNG